MRTAGILPAAFAAFAVVAVAGASLSWPLIPFGETDVLHLSPAVIHAQQNPNTLMPDQSAAKAREVINRAIQALGGDRYLGVRDATRYARLASFDTSGDLGGFTKIWDFQLFPDKNRTEHYKERNIIYAYNGDKGWVMDRAGVEDAPVASVEDFQEGMKKDVDVLFRYRMKEEGLVFRYGGPDLLDLKQVEWVEITDRDRRQMRIAFDSSSRLPIRAIYSVRDKETRARIQETEYLSNYHSFQGIMTPKHIARERNGRKVYTAFIEDCQYNTGLSEALFSRASLEDAYNKLNKKKKK
jgi:hypothetical protein